MPGTLICLPFNEVLGRCAIPSFVDCCAGGEDPGTAAPDSTTRPDECARDCASGGDAPVCHTLDLGAPAFASFCHAQCAGAKVENYAVCATAVPTASPTGTTATAVTATATTTNLTFTLSTSCMQRTWML